MKQRKLNILFLTFEGGMAGSTQSITFLAKGLADRGHKVFVGIRSEMPIWDMMEHPGITRIPMRIKGKFDFENWREIRDVVRKHQIDIINPQSSNDRYTSIFANWFYRLKTNVVHTRRQMPMSSGSLVQRWLYNKKTAGIVAVSQPVKEALVKLGFAKNHIHVIPNGTPKEKYEGLEESVVEELRSKFDIQPDDFVLGCIARPKAQEQILQALQLLPFPVKSIFVGISAEERYTQFLKDMPSHHTIFFEGNVTGKRVLHYHRLFTIKVLASTMEGLSQSLLEAMALGTPVIATAFAGNLDLIQEGENGLFFENENIKELTEKITLLKENEPLRQKLIDGGKETALNTFSIEKTISNYEEYFYTLIEQKH